MTDASADEACAMKIVTWNVNSLKARADYVSMYLDRDDAPDVLCLQELKLETDKVPRDLFESRGYHLAVHGQKQWNGVLIASRWPLTDVEMGLPMGDDGQSRLICATTEGVRLVNLYCPQGQSAESPKFAYKLRFFDALEGWLSEHMSPADPWVILGDINVAPEARDVYDVAAIEGEPTYHPEEHARWARLRALGLSDAVAPHVEPGTFSFWDYRGMAFRFNQGYRIDHLLVTEPILARVEDAWIDRKERKKKDGLTPSDHAPVGIALRT
jgi:exodeoxyribonuclease-3